MFRVYIEGVTTELKNGSCGGGQGVGGGGCRLFKRHCSEVIVNENRRVRHS